MNFNVKISSEIAVAEINQQLSLNSVNDSTGTIRCSGS